MDLLISILVVAVPVFAFSVGVVVLRYPTQFVEYHSKLEAGDETVAKLVAILLIIVSLFIFAFLLLAAV
jgi:archaellum biogenesis protein FlaJ (TadC family)